MTATLSRLLARALGRLAAVALVLAMTGTAARAGTWTQPVPYPTSFDLTDATFDASGHTVAWTLVDSGSGVVGAGLVELEDGADERVSTGMIAPGTAALLPVSAAVSPSTAPLPKSSGVRLSRLASA